MTVNPIPVAPFPPPEIGSDAFFRMVRCTP
jgi:hypothetical protein